MSIYRADPDLALQADLDLALQMAAAADAISYGRFRALDLRVDSKPDRTPVTDADKAVEQSIRETLAIWRPADAIFGEEFGLSGESSRQWIIDPIDGTANFLRGNPIWGTLIALAVEGVPVVGVASMPALSRRWWAASGLGSWRSLSNGSPEKNQVSKVTEISDAALSFPRMVGWIDAGFSNQALEINSQVWRTVGGSDLWSYCLVAEGAADAAIEFDLQPYDMAALVPIVTEAGGMFTDITGAAGPWGGNAVASNGLLHEGLLQRFA